MVMSVEPSVFLDAGDNHLSFARGLVGDDAVKGRDSDGSVIEILIHL
jgi:hypothetical protein